MARISIRNDHWELCDQENCDDRERRDAPSYFEALRLLDRMKGDAMLMGSVRRLCVRWGSEFVSGMSDAEIVELVARCLSRRQIHLCLRPLPVFGASTVPGGASEAVKVDQDPVRAARPRKTWVEFAVVDMEGKPVEGHRYIVMLPDGSLQEGRLGKTGRVRFDSIDPENSVFTLPDLDKDTWERVS